MIDSSLLKKRNLLGYFTNHPLPSNPGRPLKADADLQLSYCSNMITDDSDSFAVKELIVSINRIGHSVPIGYMHWTIFDSQCEWVGRKSFYWTCDDYSQALSDFASELLEQRKFRIEEMFIEGSFAELTRIELRESYLGKGYGKLAIQAFIKKSLLRRRVHTIFIKPFPLQYENMNPDADTNPEGCADFNKSLIQEKLILRKYYQRQLGARSLGKGSEYLYLSLRSF